MMRRMKIRAKPNFGVGAGASRSSSTKPVSQRSAACQETQENLSPPRDDEATTQPLASNSDKPSEENVEVISRTEAEGKAIDPLGEGLQEERNQSCDSASPSSFSPLNMSPLSSLTAVQKIESVKVVDNIEEHQQTGLNSTVFPAAESNVSSQSTESNASPVPSPQVQQSPQESLEAAVTQIISQSTTQTPEVTADKSVATAPTCAKMSSSDKSSEASKETQQDMEAKSTMCMRRKKLKVRPVLCGMRKGGIMDKPKTRASDQSISESGLQNECIKETVSVNNATESSDVKSECVKEKTTNQASSQNADNAENLHITFINTEAPERVDADISIVSEDPSDNQLVEPLDPDNKADRTPEPSESCKVCAPEEEAPQVRESTDQESVAPASVLSKLVVVDTTDTPVIMNQKPVPVGESKPSDTSLDRSAPGVGNKRRAKIRAMPMVVTKKKKEEDKVVTAKPLKQITIKAQPQREVSPREEVSNGSDRAESITAPAVLDAEGSAGNQTEQPIVKSSFGASKKEVSFTKTEVVDRKHTHVVNMTDYKKENKEQEETKKVRKEGHDVCKEYAESPLQSNFKSCRKKKLSENNETDPELEVVSVVNNSPEKQGKKRVHKEDSEEIGNSDDSTGDKENASSAITEISNQERAVRENKPLITQKTKMKTPSSEYSSEKLFGRLERKIKIEDSTEKAAKQVFRKRKDEFRKKLSKGDLEPGKMTMFDLIYWNPASNPMPGRTSSPKRNARSSGRSDTDSIASETAEEQQVDDLGLDPTDCEHQSRPESPEVVEVKKTQEKPSEENKDNMEEEKDPEEDSAINDEDSSAGKDVFAPRVKIGPNGEIMVDEQSIKIQTTAAKNRDEVLKKAVVVEESGDSSHYGKWSKRRRRSCEWTVKETALFYKALSTVGTDFSLMETLIKWRTRAELKTKFKKEERNNRELVDMALNDSTQFDMTVFDEESDYDPKEDRKAARQAERAEAKRRRLEMKQQDKIKEMERKKLENKKNKAETMNRKKMLRKSYRSRVKKRKETFESDNEDSPGLYDSDNNVSEDSAPEEQNPFMKMEVKPGPKLRGRQPKRRNSLVISEVTVTMETVKYDRPAEQNFVPEQTIKGPEASSECNPSSLEAGESIKGDNHRPHVDTEQNRSPEYVIPERSDEQGFREEHKGEDEMTLFNEYSELPMNEGLPESYFIESMLSDNDEANPDINQVDDLENNVSSRNETRSDEDGYVESGKTTTVLEHYTPAVEPVCEDDNQKMWHFPISAIQTLEDGQQVIPVPTPNGHYSVPVPVLPPGTSNVVVVATSLPDFPGEHIYHVYIVSPLEATDS